MGANRALYVRILFYIGGMDGDETVSKGLRLRGRGVHVNAVGRFEGAARVGFDDGWGAGDTRVLRTEVRDEVARARTALGQVAQANGLTPLPSATNFVTIDCGRDGAFARRVLAELISRDIFVRMPFVPPQDRCIRVSTGPEADLAAFAAALPGALSAAQAG